MRSWRLVADRHRLVINKIDCRCATLGCGLTLTKGTAEPLVLGEFVQHRPDIRQTTKQHLQRNSSFKSNTVGFLIDNYEQIFDFSAVPENIRMGLNIDRQCEVATVTPETIIADNAEGMMIVDLREEGERIKSGVIPGSVHAPYSRLDQHLDMLRQAEGRDVVFYCAVGERSTMAVNIARDRGVSGCAHIPGGFIAWAEAGGNIDRV